MKSYRTIYLAFFLMLSFAAFSQAPSSFKYQSMVRKADGSALANQLVKIKISIIKGGTLGSSVYSEVHSPKSNAFGIINLNIGEGSEKVGSISTIDWAIDSYFVKIEMDETGGTNYTLSSVSQLLSVPYALHANTANSIDWSKIQNKPGFAVVATSGNYKDLNNKPNLALVATSGNFNDLINKPALVTQQHFDSAINQLKLQIYNEVWINDSTGKFKDTRDNQIYNFVKIGNQIWMSQNLNYYTKTGSSYYNNDSISYAKIYGRLYQWETAKNVCPPGWHLPSESEFVELITYIGGVLSPSQGYPVGGKLKEKGTSHWQTPNTNATNSSGFNALPAGWYGSSFNYLNQEARFWTSTEKTSIPNTAAPFTLEYNSDYVRDYGFLANYKVHFLSVRCIKNK